MRRRQRDTDVAAVLQRQDGQQPGKGAQPAARFTSRRDKHQDTEGQRRFLLSGEEHNHLALWLAHTMGASAPRRGHTAAHRRSSQSLLPRSGANSPTDGRIRQPNCVEAREWSGDRLWTPVQDSCQTAADGRGWRHHRSGRQHRTLDGSAPAL